MPISRNIMEKKESIDSIFNYT